MTGATPMTSPPIPTLERTPPWLAVAGTLAMTAAAVLLARAAEGALDPQSLSLFFVAPIVLAAIRFGLWSSLMAALVGTLALNFFFVEPRYTFDVDRAQDGASLILFAVVGVIVSAIAARARADAFQAKLRAWEAVVLRDFAESLSASFDEGAVAEAAVASLSNLAQAPAALFAATGAAHGAPLDAAAQDAARWSMSAKAAHLPGADAATNAQWSFWPIVVAGNAPWALGVRTVQPVAPELGVAISQLAAQAGVALERARVTELAEQARRDAERERLKSELLAGVSHDLRTPLSTIVFTLQSLQRFAAEHDASTRTELLDLAEREARRLAGLVDTLLDASRIEAGATPVHLEQVAAEALLEQAMAQADLGGAAIDVQLPRGLPLIVADTGLAARALANLLENAHRHAGAGIVLSARAHDDQVWLEVRDRGPGLGADPEHLFQKFVRGAVGDGRAPGLGLGLPIARSLIESQGGVLTAGNGDAGGAVFRIALKAAND